MDIAATILLLETGDDVDAQVAAFDELNASVTEADLPVLTAEITRADANAWVRELLAEPALRLGGVRSLRGVLTAMRLNYEQGHDNDSLEALLVELAEAHPAAVRAELRKLEHSAGGVEIEHIRWLEDFCG